MLNIVVRSAHAPSSRGGKYRRPVRVIVARGEVKPCYRHNDPDVVATWENVDSRYDGPRSAYGQAIRAARDLVASTPD